MGADPNRICGSILETIGGTPIVRISRRMAQGCAGEILAKLETFNPGGSVKDRIGIRMIEAAEKAGKLKPGGTIIEGTSGNTGMGLALAAAVKGYRAIFTIPDKMSQEKINLLKAFGAKVIVTPTAVPHDDPRSYHAVAKRLSQEIPNSLFPDQYSNSENPGAHYDTTGPEIWEQCERKLDYFVCGCGTGGTISGAGKFLKEKNPKIRIVGVDPVGSVYTDFFKTGKVVEGKPYKVEGIGQDDFPETMDFKVLDDIVQVTDKDSFLTARRLARSEGIFVGGSGGTAMWAALLVGRKMKAGERLVVLLPDTGERYLSKCYNDSWMQENQFLEAGSEDLTALDVLSRKTGGPGVILWTRPDAIMHDVIALMKENEVSQVPVLEGSKVLGMIREEQILELLIQHKDTKRLKVSEVMGEPLPIVELDSPTDEVSKLLRDGYPAVLVRMGKGEGEYGIITKFDLLQAVAR